MNNNPTVDIWFLDYSKLSLLPYNWIQWLSMEEQQRADRFHFEKDKHAFIIYHACKRLILSNYLQQVPQEIIISIDKKGKPFIKNIILIPKRRKSRETFFFEYKNRSAHLIN